MNRISLIGSVNAPALKALVQQILVCVLMSFSVVSFSLEQRVEMAGASYISSQQISEDVLFTVAQIPMIGFEDDPEFASMVLNFSTIVVSSSGLREGGRITDADLGPMGITIQPSRPSAVYIGANDLDQVHPQGKWSELSLSHSSFRLLSKEVFLSNYSDWLQERPNGQRLVELVQNEVSKVAILNFEVKDQLDQDHPETHFLYQTSENSAIVFPSFQAGRAGLAYPIDPSRIPPEVLTESRRLAELSNPASDNTPSTPAPPSNAARESSMPRYLLIGGGLLMVLGFFSLIFTRRGG